IDERGLHFAFNAGVIESDIKVAARLHSMFDQRLDLGRDNDIRPLETCRPAGLKDQRDCFLATLNVAITDHNVCPFASKRQRSRPTDARSAASYQCNLSLKFFHERNLLDRAPS